VSVNPLAAGVGAGTVEWKDSIDQESKRAISESWNPNLRQGTVERNPRLDRFIKQCAVRILKYGMGRVGGFYQETMERPSNNHLLERIEERGWHSSQALDRSVPACQILRVKRSNSFFLTEVSLCFLSYC